MLVHALVTTIRTRPEPAVFSVLHRLDEELTHLICRCLWVAVFTEHHLPQLLFIPLFHAVLLLLFILLFLFLIPAIRV